MDNRKCVNWLACCNFAALSLLLGMSNPSLAQDNVRERNALIDIAIEQAKQSEMMRLQEQREHERAWRESNDRVNAARDAISARRFDKK